MIVSLRHLLGRIVSSFSSREDLILENLANLSPGDDSACHRKPKYLRQVKRNPFDAGATIWRTTAIIADHNGSLRTYFGSRLFLALGSSSWRRRHRPSSLRGSCCSRSFFPISVADSASAQ